MRISSFFRFAFILIMMISSMNVVFSQSTITIKLDTAGIAPYPTVYNFCTNDVDSVYLIQPTIPGMTGVRWYVPDYPSTPYYNDTVLILPQYEGAIQMMSNEGYSRDIGIWFFSTAPSHADFFVSGGSGVINTTNDTVFMCGASVEISPIVVGSEAVSWYWESTTGFYSSNAFVSLTIPGTYYLHRENPCGFTRDTFVVVSLPTVLPVWQDTSFCNTPVSLTLDPGPGWNYAWNTGATNQTLSVDTSGVYSVTLSNACSTGGTVSITVEHQSYPMPNLLSYDQGSAICADSVLILDPSPGHSYDTYQWQWSGGTATTPTLSVSGLTTGSGGYAVTVTQGGCNETAGVSLNFFETPDVPQICIVTVDVAINKNVVTWTADNEPLPGNLNKAPIAGYNIYKATSGWQFIGNVAVDQEHIFMDVSSSPPTVSALYKISAVDECGVESALSFYHKTILLAVTMGAQPGEIPLLWNPYQDESGTFEVSQYYIYRGDSPSSLTLLDSVSGMITSYIDTGIYTQKFYQIVAVKAGGCNTSPAGTKSTKNIVTTIGSNITNNVVTGVADNSSLTAISVYPNPSNGIFLFEGTRVSRIEITDGTGKFLFATNQLSIDLSDYAPGFYIATVYTNQGSTTRKLLRY